MSTTAPFTWADPTAALIRRKGHLSRTAVAALLCMGLLPVLMLHMRLAAYPGSGAAADAGIRAAGAWLNRELTLAWVPFDHLQTVLYLLLLPASALLITVARLTFGLRVLGFRAILIAVGFHEIGIVPSLALIAAVVLITLIARPALRAARLPLYARVAVILCIAALVMVAALFVGPWMRSGTVWAVAFFPVIILAMLAEGFAKTMDRDSASVALWRGGATLLVALAIAGMHAWSPVADAMLRFPELMLTHLAAIVMVSEFLDLRLLQGWQNGSGTAAGRPPVPAHVPRVAVVRDRSAGVWQGARRARGRMGSVQHLVDALRACGYWVKVFDGDSRLLGRLQRFVLPGAPPPVVLCPGAGAGPDARQVALAECAGCLVAGPAAHSRALLYDRFALLTLLRSAGVPASPVWMLEPGRPQAAQFPLALRPRRMTSGAAVVVHSDTELRDVLVRSARLRAGPLVAQPDLPGCEYRLALLGGEVPQVLAVVAVDPAGVMTTDVSALGGPLAERLQAAAVAAFRVADCRDYARVDLRLGADGQPLVVSVRAHGIFSRHGAFVHGAQAGGLSLAQLMERIVSQCRARPEEADAV